MRQRLAEFPPKTPETRFFSKTDQFQFLGLLKTSKSLFLQNRQSRNSRRNLFPVKTVLDLVGVLGSGSVGHRNFFGSRTFAEENSGFAHGTGYRWKTGQTCQTG